MTKQQATAEMKYRLSIYILQVLLDAGTITVDEAIQAKHHHIFGLLTICVVVFAFYVMILFVIISL